MLLLVTDLLFLSQASRARRIICHGGHGNFGSRMLAIRVWVYGVLWRLEATLSPVMSVSLLPCTFADNMVCVSIYLPGERPWGQREDLRKQLIKTRELHVDNRASKTSGSCRNSCVLWGTHCPAGIQEARATHSDKGWVAKQIKGMYHVVSYISDSLPRGIQGRIQGSCSFNRYFTKLSAFPGNHHVKYHQPTGNSS